MELSARNQLRGTVTSMKAGAVMSEVTVHVNPGDMTAAITETMNVSSTLTSTAWTNSWKRDGV